MKYSESDYIEIGKDFIGKIPRYIWYNESPVEYVTGLENLVAELRAENKKLKSIIENK